ncbi:hypothetical protein AA313_de0204742 [Arthrobotrys entomopaga]|nr:hypothetical protein AA313_de0204742 [Arthrobotrys entomopaga]
MKASFLSVALLISASSALPWQRIHPVYRNSTLTTTRPNTPLPPTLQFLNSTRHGIHNTFTKAINRHPTGNSNDYHRGLKYTDEVARKVELNAVDKVLDAKAGSLDPGRQETYDMETPDYLGPRDKLTGNKVDNLVGEHLEECEQRMKEFKKLNGTKTAASRRVDTPSPKMPVDGLGALLGE